MEEQKLRNKMAELNPTEFIEYLELDFFKDGKKLDDVREDMQEIECLDETDLNYGIAFMSEIENQILTAKYYFFIGTLISALSSLIAIDIPFPLSIYLIVPIMVIIVIALWIFYKNVTEDIYNRSIAKRFRRLLEFTKEVKNNKDN
ncbi:hypothetical protein [Bacillus pumilus]|uniref:hypothetical protein n=1 Tax=Bacillus pumilus TaxID=1408 RepID=UPI0011A0A235|nr:hypothetical protein [Bacillus pumilus]